MVYLKSVLTRTITNRELTEYKQFRFKSAQGLLRKAADLGINLPFRESVANLFAPLQIGTKIVPNRIVVQPMEGCDGNLDGSPGELTFRRYRRYAEGGNGMIWFEATSISPDGRSNPHQLMLNRKTVGEFARLVESTRISAAACFGDNHQLILVLQLTHSGRYSKPEGVPTGKAAFLNPYLDQTDQKPTLFTDNELEQVMDCYLQAVSLARKAGFDAVDIKACHGYLLNELLAAHTRSDSRFGGSFENRARLLLEVIKQSHETEPNMITAVRLNAADGLPHPYGFGTTAENPPKADLTEPMRLVQNLIANRCSLFNISAGIPSYAPHIGRPFDRPAAGTENPPEHPLWSVHRLLNLAAEFQCRFPDISFVGSGYSWLRQFWPNIASGVLEGKMASLIGLGRSSFAYPDAPKDLMNHGALNPQKTCIACSRCTELMRRGSSSGCVIRDREIYRKKYEEIFE